MKRKIIQVILFGRFNSKPEIVLCDDGTVWKLSSKNNSTEYWVQIFLPDIPESDANTELNIEIIISQLNSIYAMLRDN